MKEETSINPILSQSYLLNPILFLNASIKNIWNEIKKKNNILADNELNDASFVG